MLHTSKQRRNIQRLGSNFSRHPRDFGGDGPNQPRISRRIIYQFTLVKSFRGYRSSVRFLEHFWLGDARDPGNQSSL